MSRLQTIWPRLILIAGVVLLTACGSVAKKDEHWVWPLPPEEPRLKYIKSIRSSTDVKPENASDTFKQLLAGMSQNVSLIKPYGVAVFDKTIYVTDTILGRLLVFNQNKKTFKIFGNKGAGRLNKPISVAVDQQGMVYVTDIQQSRVIVYDNQGNYQRAMGGPKILTRPTGVTVNPINDNVYVVNTGTLDSQHHAVSVFNSKGRHLFDFGERGSDKAKFNFPTNICSDAEGQVYIVDTGNFRVQIFNSEGEYLDGFGKVGTGLGSFARPKGIAVDSEGHIYVIDSAFNNVQIFDKDKHLLLFAGTMGKGAGEFWLPAGMWIDTDDRIYIADQYNHRIQIWQFMKPQYQQKSATVAEKK
jgi:DNA-binding beta-propeller fold protein YncE